MEAHNGGGARDAIFAQLHDAGRTEQVTARLTDAIILGGYTPDTTVALKDLFRAGWDGITLGFAYSINQELVEAMPVEIQCAISPGLGC